MGRSPVLPTVTVRVCRPTLSSMSPSRKSISPGIILASRYGIMDGHQFRAVGEGGLYLHLGDDLGHAIHHVVSREELRAVAHELRHRPSVPRALQDRRRDVGDRLGMVQLEPAGL